MRRLSACLACLFLVPAVSAAEPGPQWRALWVDAFNPGIKTPEQVEQLVADVQALNCNTIIAQVRKRGDAYFRKSIAPFTEDAEVPAGFDPLADLLSKAHQAGIQVHAWVNAMTLWRATDAPPGNPQHLFNAHGPRQAGRANWLTCDEAGRNRFPVGYFLDPGHPDVADHLVRVVTDLARNYPVDGIHLDYIRYPELGGKDEGGPQAVGYNPVSVARFNRVHGTTGLPARHDPAWNAWRRQQVTQLVRRMRAELLEVNPRVIFSAALIPWGDGPADEAGWEQTAPYSRVFQDWHAWRREGLLDVTVPMNYNDHARDDHRRFFANWLSFERGHRYRAQLIVGLGAYRNTLENTLTQVRLALEGTETAPPADGVCFFSYAAFRRAGGPTLADLKRVLVGDQQGSAPFARPAPLPKLARLDKPTEGTLAGFATDAQGRPLDAQEVKVEQVDGRGVAGTQERWQRLFCRGFPAAGALSRRAAGPQPRGRRRRRQSHPRGQGPDPAGLT